jgi:hypothetical protein
MTPTEYKEWQAEQKALSSARSRLAWMFIGSLAGVTAPVLGTIAGIYAYKKRKKLAGAGGTYLAMGYGSAALAGIYTVIIAVLALGG